MSIAGALNLLRDAADTAARGLVPGDWRKLSGPGPDLAATELGGRHDAQHFFVSPLALEPGQTLSLASTLDIPESLAGTELSGAPLLCTVNCLYPVSVRADSREVFADALPTVAAGPAQLTAVEQLVAGQPVELELRVHSPHQQLITNWCQLHFSTPALHRRFIRIDTAWAQLYLAAQLATGTSARQAVETAAALVADGLPADLRRCDELLAELADQLAPALADIQNIRVHAIGHSHIDLAWCWTWTDTKAVIKRDARAILELLEEFPEATFTHSQPAGYEVLRTEEPDLFAAIVKLVAAGRWEPASMQWVEGDLNLAGGEAQARQLLEGVRWTRQHLGVRPRAFLAPDTFGHAGNIPQLAVSAGAEVYYHGRGRPRSSQTGQAWPAYWWEGVDGTRLLAVTTPQYAGQVSPSRIAKEVVAAIGETGLRDCLYFYGVGDHGGGPTRQNLETIRALSEIELFPRISCSTLGAYAAALRAGNYQLPVHRGESITVFEGCYTTHADAKAANRAGENSLTATETLSVMAGVDATAELSEAWRRVLFHQFHDILDGSAIKDAYQLTGEDAAQVRATTSRITARCLDVLATGCPPGAIVVTNTLGFPRRDVVVVPGLVGTGAVRLRSADGSSAVGQYGKDGLVFLADLGPFATRAYQIAEAVAAEPSILLEEHLSPTYPGALYHRIDTPYFRAMLRADCGVLTALYDKQLHRELVGYASAGAVDLEQVRPDLALGVVQTLHELPHLMSAWVSDEVRQETSWLRGASVSIAEQGPVRTVFSVHQQVDNSRVDREVIFYAGMRRIDFEFDIDWQETGGPEHGVPALTVAFATRQLDSEAWFETPFAAARRPADGLLVPALRWADIGGTAFGLAVLNAAKYGHDALGTRLRVHLLRSAYEPDPASDTGYRDRTRIAVLPHAGDWRSAQVPQAAAAFNEPFAVQVSRDRSGDDAGRRPQLPNLAPGSAGQIVGLKHRSDGRPGFVLRLYEPSGQAGRARLVGFAERTRVSVASLIEEPSYQLTATDGGYEIALRPHQVVTLVADQA